MVFFQKVHSSDDESGDDGYDPIRLREDKVVRREAEALKREKELAEKQLEIDRHYKTLRQKESDLIRWRDKLAVTARQVKAKGDSSTDLPAPAENTPPQQEDEEVQQRLADLEKREARLKNEQARLGDLSDELDRQSADLAIREAKLAKKIHETKSGDSGSKVDASLLSAYEVRIKELEEQLVALPESESSIDPQLSADLEQRAADLERQAADLKQREEGLVEKISQHAVRVAEFERTKNELEARQFELDRRELELMAMQSELQDTRDALEMQMKEFAADGSSLSQSSPVKEPLPDYCSEVSVLRADQRKLQERLIAGLNTQHGAAQTQGSFAL